MHAVRTQQAAEPTTEMVRLDLIDASPTNPRTDLSDLTSLATSIARRLEHPVTLRPRLGGRYEIISGHRRCAAARLNGWTEIRAEISERSNRETMISQLAANEEAAPLHYLDEAAAYQRILEYTGDGHERMSIAELATEIGQSRSYVEKRVRLLALSDEAQELARASGINRELALLIARLPAQKQKETIHELLTEQAGGYTPSGRTFAGWLAQRFGRDLANAPWGENETVGNDPACSLCPHRLKSGDERTCLDRLCFDRKMASTKPAQESTDARPDDDQDPAEEQVVDAAAESERLRTEAEEMTAEAKGDAYDKWKTAMMASVDRASAAAIMRGLVTYLVQRDPSGLFSTGTSDTAALGELVKLQLKLRPHQAISERAVAVRDHLRGLSTARVQVLAAQVVAALSLGSWPQPAEMMTGCLLERFEAVTLDQVAAERRAEPEPVEKPKRQKRSPKRAPKEVTVTTYPDDSFVNGGGAL